VLKKRWSTIIREVERQYSSTLQVAKKEGLRQELDRLHSYTFAVFSKRSNKTHIVLATVSELMPSDLFNTVYLTIPLDHITLLQLMRHLQPQGFLVTYTGWPDILPSSSRV
jgi:hypothetical protein